MMPLTLADTGATYTILKVGGKPEVRAHLTTWALWPGAMCR